MPDKELRAAQAAIPATEQNSEKAKTKRIQMETPLLLIRLLISPGWQLPSEIDYDTLSKKTFQELLSASKAGQASPKNNAAHSSGIDKSFKTHIEEFQKRGVPVAVYAYVRGSSVKNES